MAQSQVQVQKQEQALKQTQAITQQQMLQSHLVELPINQLLERINTEMDDNPALEAEPQGEPAGDDGQPADQSQDDGQAEEDYATVREREERQSALDEALASIGRDDGELPVYHGGQAAAVMIPMFVYRYHEIRRIAAVHRPLSQTYGLRSIQPTASPSD